jgi:outer membrane protein assembly factor BamB
LGRVQGSPQFFYGGGDGRCYGFTLLQDGLTEPTTLNEVWRFDCNPPGYRERRGTPIDYWALVRGNSSEFRADSELISPNEIIGTPVFYDDRVYVAIGQDPVHGRGRGALSCIDPAGTGDITKTGNVWQYTAIGRSMSTVSAADGLVYVAERDGLVHCLDAKTGTPQWIHDTGEEIWSSTFVADGKVYIGTRKGLVVLEAGRTEKLLSEIKLGTPVWSVPSAANGVLYVATQRNLFAVQEQLEGGATEE